MTEDALIAFIGGLDGVEVVVAGPDNGAPESAWGDVFFSLPAQRMPFATIVKRDQPGFDESSRLDRNGVFRLNLAVGREALRARFGDADGGGHDPAAFDRLFPHPVYAGHGWVSVLNPDTTDVEVRALALSQNRRRASERFVRGNGRHGDRFHGQNAEGPQGTPVTRIIGPPRSAGG
jgi:hypothetical protein